MQAVDATQVSIFDGRSARGLALAAMGPGAQAQRAAQPRAHRPRGRGMAWRQCRRLFSPLWENGRRGRPKCRLFGLFLRMGARGRNWTALLASGAPCLRLGIGGVACRASEPILLSPTSVLTWPGAGHASAHGLLHTLRELSPHPLRGEFRNYRTPGGTHGRSPSKGRSSCHGSHL